MRVLDLFCGAGGFAQGFKKAGFEVTGVDISEIAGKTFQLNGIGNFIKADLSKELIQGKYEIITGGPPCKPWAAVNTTRRTDNHSDYHLLSGYFKHVESHLPKIFLFENVPLIVNDKILKKSLKKLSKKNYSIISKVISYSDYGAPTSRQRLIIVGIRNENAGIFFQMLTECECSPRTVKEAIWKLRNIEKGEIPDHVWSEPKTINKYRKYYKTGKFGWHVLKWDRPAPSFGNIMKTYILHPDSFNGNGKAPRVVSIKEALLIMGFEKDFQFPESMSLEGRYQMVVDSVSPVFSYTAARVIKEILNK